MPTLSDYTVTITATFIHKTERAVRLRMGDREPLFFAWIPMSQIYNLYDLATNPIEYEDLIKEEEYLIDISGWISLKVFDVESIQELSELEIDYVSIRNVGEK